MLLLVRQGGSDRAVPAGGEAVGEGLQDDGLQLPEGTALQERAAEAVGVYKLPTGTLCRLLFRELSDLGVQ